MHHDVAATVATLLGGIRAGRPQEHPSGLTVVPLEDVDGRRHSGLRPPDGVLEVGETTPPSAGELVVANRRLQAITLYQGDLFTGGLAERAAVAAMVVGPGEQRLLAVEPTEPRWWWTGPPVLDGALDPPLSALVALADLDGSAGGGLSAIARSCLWAVAPRGSADADPSSRDDAPARVARGWVLLADEAVLATRVWVGPRSLTEGRSEAAVLVGDASATAQRFLAELARARWRATASGMGAAEIPGHHGRASLHDGRIVELGTVRLSEELVDVLNGGRPTRTPVQ